MPEPLGDAVGERMYLDDYYRDFERHFWQVSEFWKLERGQSFAEPGDASWEAFNQGDWAESMRRLEIRRSDLLTYHRQADDAGVSTRRIRVVERPLSAYLQWELNLLKIRDETGGPIRVIDRSKVAEFEIDEPLPEIYTLGDTVMYQAIYDRSGVLAFALKYTDTELIKRSRDFIRRLYERGEPIGSFFRREVGGLPPASPELPLPDGYLAETGRPGPIRS
jgi:hypothetical protein